jgi:hypothetical protein
MNTTMEDVYELALDNVRYLREEIDGLPSTIEPTAKEISLHAELAAALAVLATFADR